MKRGSLEHRGLQGERKHSIVSPLVTEGRETRGDRKAPEGRGGKHKLLWLTLARGQELDLWEKALGGADCYKEPRKGREKGLKKG